MSKVTVLREFKWSPDGNETLTERVGTVVEGRAAAAALAMGCGEPIVEKAAAPAPENKAMQNAPRNKSK